MPRVVRGRLRSAKEYVQRTSSTSMRTSLGPRGVTIGQEKAPSMRPIPGGGALCGCGGHGAIVSGRAQRFLRTREGLACAGLRNARHVG